MDDNKISNLTISSAAFKDEGEIPIKYTCDGEGINPPLKVEDIPELVQTLAIIVEDPDAPNGTFDHWIIWNIPVANSDIAESSNPGVSGTNSAGKTGYHPPCPPHGSHHYFFNVYGLNDRLTIEPGAKKSQLLKAMQSHLIAKGSLMGKYDREPR